MNVKMKIYKIKLYYYMRVDIKRLQKKDIYSSTKLKPLVANMLSLSLWTYAATIYG